MTAALLYLVLSELGEMGEYPDVAELTAVLNVHRASIWRAEKALQAAGLLTLTMVGKAHSRRKWNYVVGRPDRITFAQQWAWKSMTEPEAKPDDNTPESVEIVPQESPDARVPPVVEAGTTTPPPPAADTPNTPAPARKKKKMDSVVAEWFLANPENMDLYLRFDVNAYGKTQAECEANLKPSNTDWQAFRLPAFSTWPAETQASYLLYPYPKPEEGTWTHNHFMGYFWQGVCRWRVKHNIPITFPRWDRLAGEIKNLLATMTPHQAYTFIYFTMEHFDLIRFKIGKIGSSLILDEAALTHKLIRDQMMIIASLGDHAVAQEYEKMAQANQQTRR